MGNRDVLIVTGDRMYEISNQVFKMDVGRGETHTIVMENFMREHALACYDADFDCSYIALQLASMGNVLVLTGFNMVILALPTDLTLYQKEYLDEMQDFMLDDKKLLCIMNLYESGNKKEYEGIGSSDAKLRFSSLIESKVGKVKKI